MDEVAELLKKDRIGVGAVPEKWNSFRNWMAASALGCPNQRLSAYGYLLWDS
ncbi:hypothetical protein T03_16747 [Trichinella britovi]|uniref:Uncharacterized protein n=1 Tax=Trichinella britovi TaxID=45882 RepID=A0A0V0ZF47_TRIBR|nr:hypothetical protein T03_16747 [Trichinella britovi]